VPCLLQEWLLSGSRRQLNEVARDSGMARERNGEKWTRLYPQAQAKWPPIWHLEHPIFTKYGLFDIAW